jgi:gentisate 1,2-dioxygenase
MSRIRMRRSRWATTERVALALPVSGDPCGPGRAGGTGQGDPFDGVILEYTNPVTGGAVMPTIGCYLQLLRPGHCTRAHRHTSNTAYHVVEGEGFTVVDGARLDWEDKDVFVVPTWMFHEHVNTGDRDAVLFSHTDAPLMRALGVWREETRV